MDPHDAGGGQHAELTQKVALLPDQPGVYLFRGPDNEALYIGKAQSLRQRVRSYFGTARHLEPRKAMMVDQATDLEYIATHTAVEALILESTLIKKHRPRYNVMLRDDKQYPYVRVGLGEEYPGVTLVRQRDADGARYLGPYTESRALRETLRTLRRIFAYRACSRVQARDRPCLDRFIGRCLGPCQGDVSPEQYREMIDGLLLFMSGRDDEVRGLLQRRMDEAAAELAFERAASYRDQIRSLDAVVDAKKAVTTIMEDRDVVALAADPLHACAQVFFFRRGRLVGRDVYFLRGAATGQESEAMAAFLSQYYAVAAEIPGEILLSSEAEDQAVLEQWLSGLRGKKARLRAPRRGEARRLVDLAASNAKLALEERFQSRELGPDQIRRDLVELQGALQLDDYPHRIECFDVSNTSGQDAVASMVVFEGGQPRKSDYRRFRLESPGPDDYAMMREAIRRRLRRRGSAGGRQGAGSDASADKRGESFAVLPDLVVVDGGRGQARAAAEVLASEGLAAIPVFGLAKQQELLYGPGDDGPVMLPAGSGALFVLKRLRDEAHRFALAYHRRMRAKRALTSVLDGIPGLGPARRTMLLRHFGSGKAVAAASLEQLQAVPRLPQRLAREIYDRFHPEGESDK
jgi:excinuclease ABC subunit C